MKNEDQIAISVVVPAYNEQEVLPEFHKRLGMVLTALQMKSEIVYVNDGSCDATLTVMHELQKRDPRVAVVDLSRNFGKEIALTAGLDHTHGDAIVVIDADLQDPPELIPELVKQWQAGYDNVYAKRTEREGETFLKKATAHAFYRTIQKMSRIKIPEDTGDFRLLSRRAVNSLLQLREHHRFMKGLFTWIGYPSIAVPYKRDQRFAGETKWNYWNLWNLALEGITSFSIGPLKIATYMGFAFALTAFIYAIYIVLKTIMYGDPARGYPSLMAVILLLGGVQLISLGIIGEYLGRMFNEIKGRPLYFVNAHLASRLDEPHGGGQHSPEKPDQT